MSIIPQIIANSIIAGAIYALVALGFNLIYRTTKFFNLAHGALTVVGGYAMLFLYKQLEWNLYASAALAVVFTGAVGYALDKAVFRPLRKRNASQMVFLIASLGLAPKIVKEMFEKIREINEVKHTAIIVVEHNIKSILDIAQTAYVLDKGKIAAGGDARDIAQSDILGKVFLGKAV